MAQTQVQFRENIRVAMVDNSPYESIAGETMPDLMEETMTDSMSRLSDPIWDMVASWALGLEGDEFPDERVRMSLEDPLTGYLGDKIDDDTIKFDEGTFKLYVNSLPLASDTQVGGSLIGVSADSVLYMQGQELLVRTQTSTSLSNLNNEVPTSRAVKIYVDSAIQAAAPGGTAGDMLKSIYDTNLNGIVDDSTLLGGELPSHYLDWGNFTNTPVTFVGYGITDTHADLPGLLNNDHPQYLLKEAWNGTFQESFNAIVTSNGTVISLTLEKKGGGDLTMQFSDAITILDCTPISTIVLTAGSDTIPQDNFVYIPQSTKVLTLSPSGWPTTEHIKIGYFYLQSASTVQTIGALVNQNHNDELSDDTGQGHITHIGGWIRRMGAQWHSGCDPAGTDGYITPYTGGATIQIGSGVISQMHLHNFQSKDTGAGDHINVGNYPGEAFKTVSDLNETMLDSTGSSLSGKYFNIIIGGVANKGGEYSPIMMKLPSGSYNNATDAINDVDSYDSYTIGDAFRRNSSTGFLIARITFKHSVVGGGTWTIVETTDLRDYGGSGGGSGGVGTVISEFADNHFTIYDNLDITKRAQFTNDNITTGNTRILTLPDRDLDLANPVFDSLYTDILYERITDAGVTIDGLLIKDSDLSIVNSIQFNLNPTVTHSEGLQHWNADDGTMEIGMPGGIVNLQVGQEQLIRTTNSTGVTVTDGKLICFTGATGQRPTFELSSASSTSTTYRACSMTTEPILNNTSGYGNTFGKVRGLNTSAFTAGDTLWLSATNPGEFTNVPPSAPNHRVQIGIVLYSHATEGIVHFRPFASYSMSDLQDVNGTTPTTILKHLVWDDTSKYWDAGQISYNDLADIPIEFNPSNHAASHEVGGTDLINHDNLTGYITNEHINWTNTTDNLLTSGSISTSGIAYIDTINEYTSDNGIIIENVELKDNNIKFDQTKGIYWGDSDTYITETSDDILGIYCNNSLAASFRSSGLWLSSHIYQTEDGTKSIGSSTVGWYALYTGLVTGRTGLPSSPAGHALHIKGGPGYATGDNAGGSLYLYGGIGTGTGANGSLYLGNGSSISIPSDDTEDHIVTINSTTGLLSYRAVSSL